MHQLDDNLADVLNVYRSSLHRFIIAFRFDSPPYVTLNYVDRESIFITYNNLSLLFDKFSRNIRNSVSSLEGIARFRARVA